MKRAGESFLSNANSRGPTARAVKLLRAMIVVLSAASVSTLLTGCGSSDDGASIDISEDDPQLVYARQNARATVGQFIYALENPRAGQTLFAVKAKFIDGEAVEYMWLTDLGYDNGSFIGVLNNQPAVVTNVRMGQEHTVPAHEIDDWMIIDNGQIIGGYSVQLVAARQSPDTSLH